jgi:hypothetical protein
MDLDHVSCLKLNLWIGLEESLVSRHAVTK